MTILTAATKIRGSRALRVGVAVGLSVTARVMAERVAVEGRKGLVDWDRAQRIARGRLSTAPGQLSPSELVASAVAYERHMTAVVPLLEERLGAALPGVVDRHDVVTRAEWAEANMGTFKALISHLEPHLSPLDASANLRSGVAAAANRMFTTGQVGFLLAYLGTRVLGQYDIALLSAEHEPGRLLYVEENIRATARSVRVPIDDFRLWVCLHETTHAFELEAHPWLRPYLRIVRTTDRALRRRDSPASASRPQPHRQPLALCRRRGLEISGFLSPEQRGLFRETQLVMSLMEGFSDWVMDDVGREVLPDVTLIRQRFEARRNQRRRGIDRLMARLTGMDLKLEQYRRGERFVAGVNAVGGAAAVAHLWDGPSTLPTDAEMDEPALWVQRVAPTAITAATSS